MNCNAITRKEGEIYLARDRRKKERDCTLYCGLVDEEKRMMSFFFSCEKLPVRKYLRIALCSCVQCVAMFEYNCCVRACYRNVGLHC